MKLQKKTILLPEWSQQDAVLLCWPHKSMDWQPILDEVEPSFVEMAYYICQHQKLVIIAHDQTHESAIRDQLFHRNINLAAVSWLHHKNNDSWCRDFGPVTVIENNQLSMINFQFNGWGGKYAYAADNETNQQLFQQGIIKNEPVTSSLVLEGGSIESDGLGTILTTEKCLLNLKRNPDLSKQDIEHQLEHWLGCKRILWLSKGYLEGDDTDSHIDNLARFCSEDTIAYASSDDTNDAHYQPLKEMEKELQKFKTIDNKPYKLIALNIPAAKFDDGNRLPASYANFLITNKFVLMPTYNDKQDETNLNKLQSVFKDRTVVGIDCESIIKQLGSVHCLSMQLPEHSLKINNNE